MWHRKKKKVQTTLDSYIVKPMAKRAPPFTRNALEKFSLSIAAPITVSAKLQENSPTTSSPNSVIILKEIPRLHVQSIAVLEIDSPGSVQILPNSQILLSPVGRKVLQEKSPVNTPLNVREKILVEDSPDLLQQPIPTNRFVDDSPDLLESFGRRRYRMQENCIVGESPVAKIDSQNAAPSGMSQISTQDLQEQSPVLFSPFGKKETFRQNSPIFGNSNVSPLKDNAPSSPIFKKRIKVKETRAIITTNAIVTTKDNSLLGDSILNESYHYPPKKPETPTKYKYKSEVVRKKEERRKLRGYACHCCKDYYDALGLSPESLQKRLNHVSRHRDRQPPPSTPEYFWEVGFPDTPEILARQAKFLKRREDAKKKRQ